MPDETISFLTAANFDMVEKKNYKRWTVIASDVEVNDYGGWLCGGATALYQWVVSNQWLSLSMRNHSKRFKWLYTAMIDGVSQSTPWLDATIYAWSIDFKITNIRPYPIIIVMNYDGSFKWRESVFTIARSEDVWSLEYVWKRWYRTTMSVPWTGSILVNWQCYTRLINWKKQERCYKEIK